MIPALLRRRRGSLLWLIGIVVLAIVLGVLATIPLLRGTPDGRIGSLVGQPAPALEAEDLDGRSWSLADGRRAAGMGQLLGHQLRAVPDRDAGHAAPRRGSTRTSS